MDVPTLYAMYGVLTSVYIVAKHQLPGADEGAEIHEMR